MYSRRSVPLGAPSFLNAMKNIDMTDSRPVLPAQITAKILDYLDIPDLMRCARASRRLCEMVYQDSRWVARLQSMGCWNEAEARQRFDDAERRRRHEAAQAQTLQNDARPVVGRGQPIPGSTMLFDQAVEEENNRRRVQAASQAASQAAALDGFHTLSVTAATDRPPVDPADILDVLKRVQSIRGRAREEFGKIYGALAPFYNDLVRSKSHTDPIVFKVFRDPERQAQMLANLRIFARSDWAAGALEREERVMAMMGIFESAALREFEQGYEFWDIDGRMRRYANVLHLLNGGAAGVTLFLEKHPIFSDADILGRDPLICLNHALDGAVLLEPSHAYFQAVLGKLNEQAGVISRIFPDAAAVFWAFVEKVRDELINDFITPLFDDAHKRNIESYLKAVSGVFEQSVLFFAALQPPGFVAAVPAAEEDGDAERAAQQQQQKDALKRARDLTWRLFEPHLFTYLQEELDFFATYADGCVEEWQKKLSDQDASQESFFMSSFNNRQADKKDFMSSFKKVVMMPVAVLPTFNFSSTKPDSEADSAAAAAPAAAVAPDLGPQTSSTQEPSAQAPTDELAAKAALMASRLKGIKSLFSMDIALDLIQHAKISIGRAAVFIPLGAQAGGEAREQCQTIFAALTRSLGAQHMHAGFQKAIAHLAAYNPRDATEQQRGADAGVAPLVMFIELVNVGDLISQMIDVFYEQQLVSAGIVDKNDFLDPAAKAKKKFEQQLDENVAAGLNKGIDVLMHEVEYLHATTQMPTDYNPPDTGPAAKRGTLSDVDIGPTPTAVRIVDLVSAHTRMLVGTTEKAMLDVFNGEVGLRLFTCICKHLKRQRISTAGAVKLIADMNAYWTYIRTLKNPDLQVYFGALRELSQIYLIDGRHAKEMAAVIADSQRFAGIFRAEEVYEYAQRRADWYSVKKDVERAMYGMDCVVM
ncbi:hypothetical protein TD95_000192 [Thielaviopsis punctulata]|uniref:F-box domain-containing protein n=1 Tax=Thielaviopsis punctulata TaxID=72032 RepID=A0A0F4ZE24_9PEZI|nr:hypothetical protein TD95_000192 [Thielaviopsis punctulata]